MEKKTNIIFDFGGVLIDLDMMGMQSRMTDLGARADLFFVKSDDKDSSTVCNGLSVSGTLTRYQVGKMTTEEFVSLLRSNCRQETTDDEIISVWNSCLVGLPLERLEMIRELRQKGYRTYLLSNINDLHWVYIEKEYFEKRGFRSGDFFDGIYLSHEVHFAKPDPEFFRMVLREIGCPAQECLFIDDSLANVEASRKEGIPSEWLDLEKEDIIRLIDRIQL